MAKTRAKSQPPSAIETLFIRSNERTFAGYAVDIKHPDRTFTIDLVVDGYVVKTAFANERVHELVARSIGNGCYGFSLSLGQETIENAHMIEARLSNLDQRIGQAIVIDNEHHQRGDLVGPGLVRWLGGLRFSGWIGKDSPTGPIIDVAIDGELITRVKALGWAHVGHDGDNGRAVRAFDFHLPVRFADGLVHRLSVTDDKGTTLGTPGLPFVAFADGLANAISQIGQLDSERFRGEMFDLLLPMSLPISDYDTWREQLSIEPPEPTDQKAAVILIGPGNVNKTLASLEEQTRGDWIAASLTVDGKQSAFEPDEARSFLDGDGQDCDFVVFALSGSHFETDALARIARAFKEAPDAKAIYGDVDTAARDGSRWPLAFPAFDYERMLEQGYCAHLFAIRRRTALRNLARGASNLYRMFNSLFDIEGPRPGDVIHIPRSLAIIPPIEISEASTVLRAASAAHLKERGISATVTLGSGMTMPAIRISRASSLGKTTVIIPTRDRLSLLKKCLDTIKPALEKVATEIIIVDNGSSDPNTLKFLADISDNVTQVLRVEGPFNFARLNNVAAQAARNEYLCLLNNDIEAMDDAWLEEMLGRISEPDVGAVGALLLWPSGVVQHGGVVLGPVFSARHAFNDRVQGDPAYGDLMRVAHECSAVTAACMLTRRRDYLNVGGLDETAFAVAFNDVDYCLKLRASGKRIVFTPNARLWHNESSSRGNDNHPRRKARYQREEQILRARWTSELMDDPYYSPVLSLDAVPFSGLSWPPRSMDPRPQKRPVENEIPPGF